MSIENTEYALIQLLLRNPQVTVELKRKGLRGKFFRNKKLGNAFNHINATYTGMGSIPTAEELALFDVKIDKSDILYTVEHLTNNIVDAYNKQVMGQIIENTTDGLVDGEGGWKQAKDVWQKNIKKLVYLNEEKKYLEAPAVLDNIWERYVERAEWNASGKVGIPLGLHILDSHIRGLEKGWLITIAARNGVGKSWLLANAVLAAWRQKRTVAVFSCEMTSLEFLQRIICMDARINPTKFSHGESSLEDIEKFKESALRCEQDYGMHFIIDNPVSLDNIEDVIKEINEKNPDNPIEAVYIDAAYRLQIEGESEVVKQKRIAMISKDLAKKFNIPFVITVQMNREGGKANSGKVNKIQAGNYSLAGSDAFNTESDVIILLNKNEEVYASFNYIDMRLEKFRHGQDEIDYMIEMNLNIPQLKQVDYGFCRTRIGTDLSSTPASTKNANNLIQQSKDIFNKNKNISSDDIMENFKKHKESQQSKKENEVMDDD